MKRETLSYFFQGQYLIWNQTDPKSMFLPLQSTLCPSSFPYTIRSRKPSSTPRTNCTTQGFLWIVGTLSSARLKSLCYVLGTRTSYQTLMHCPGEMTIESGHQNVTFTLCVRNWGQLELSPEFSALAACGNPLTWVLPQRFWFTWSVGGPKYYYV